MKVRLSLRSPQLLVPIALLGSALLASAAPKCDDISNDVRKAISSDPARTLMIVEDALVINESCACEIVRAAIEASKADTKLKQDIVQTALAVAPKMAPMITECAGIEGNVPVATAAASATGAPAYEVPEDAEVTYSGKSGKGAKSVLPVAPVEPVEEFTYIPRDIRGIYLIAPGGVGVIGQRTTEEVCEDDKDKDKDKDKHKPPHRRVISPVSKSIATN
jgi:hypothetical protein